MFLIALLLLVMFLVVVSILAAKRVETMADYVIAGQQFGYVISTCALVSTWYGAESLLTLSDEVRRVGVSAAWLDPIGVSLCLLLAGILVVPKLYHRKTDTIGELFREAGGRPCEIVCCMIVVPSYFGWIAAQLIALSLLFQTYLETSFGVSIAMSLAIACSLSLWGGNESLGWINTLLLFLIIAGLIILIVSIASDGIWFRNDTWDLTENIPASHLSWTDPDLASPYLAVLGTVVIGSVGNLPAIELIQRIRAAKNVRVARWACVSASAIYLSMGVVPVLIGLSYVAHGWTGDAEQTQVLSILAKYHLSKPFQVVFFLSIVATILSTLVSASVSPATMLGMSLIEPILNCNRRQALDDSTRIHIQRLCVTLMLLLGTVLALSGETAYQLVRDSYGLLLASIVVPFLAILLCKTPPRDWTILFSIFAGTIFWCGHWFLGRKEFVFYFPDETWSIPHELGDACVCLLTFAICGMAFNHRPSKNS